MRGDRDIENVESAGNNLGYVETELEEGQIMKKQWSQVSPSKTWRNTTLVLDQIQIASPSRFAALSE